MDFEVALSNFEKGKNCGEAYCDGGERARSPRYGALPPGARRGIAPTSPPYIKSFRQTLIELELELGRRVLGHRRSQVPF